ncbi:hypothetical protein T492DRAFT_455695 [Pavlovales sp. CCMP2436]|nr:hypothetical protein T492DRAFT_455695 [Pavlovales sp. CCMP2436]
METVTVNGGQCAQGSTERSKGALRANMHTHTHTHKASAILQLPNGANHKKEATSF